MLSEDLLNRTHQWPCEFLFKFVLPKESLSSFEMALNEFEFNPLIRPSSGGKYLGYTFTLRVESAEQILSVYERVKSVSGLMAL